jgi:hypothetical protein
MVFEMAPAPWRDRDSEERLVVVKSGESSGCETGREDVCVRGVGARQREGRAGSGNKKGSDRGRRVQWRERKAVVGRRL